MKKRILSMLLLWACMLGVLPASAAFKDIKIDLTNGNLLTADEVSAKTTVTFGVAIASDGTASRVASDDASAVIVLSGKYHSAEHGWNNFTATVPVEGPVKVSMGSCAWGGDVTVKNSSNETVATFNTNNGKCYHGDKTNNIVSAYYKGSAATTLTISGGSYTPYIAVETADPSELKTEYTVTFTTGDSGAQGTAPAAVTAEDGSSYTLPLNRTLYVEGKTLTAWTDGTNSYKPGDAMTVTANVTLTPVFTANTTTLAQRTEEVSLLWDFQRKNGAPTLAYQGQTGIYVTQATIGTETIDVKMDFDATSGKIANAAWTDWCQWNKGTKFTIPSCVGATVSVEAYSELGRDGKTATTIDGQSDYTSAKIISYTVGSKAETIDIVVGDDGSYYRYVKIILPVVKSSGKTFTNEAATIIYPYTGNMTDEPTTTPDGAFTLCTSTNGANLTAVSSASYDGTTYTRFQPTDKGSATNDENAVIFKAVPTKGLTFTPTKVSANILRFGTDGGQMSVRIRTEEGKEETLATGIKPHRNKATSTDGVFSFEYEVPAGYDTQSGFSLLVNIYDNTGKQFGLNNVTITGTVNGETQDVAKHKLTMTASPAEGGTVSVYPNADEYDEGTELKITATKNFGYKFVNWTNAAGAVVSAEPVFNLTLDTDTALTANFQKLNTYSLAVEVEKPANDYMVSISPAPTVVDGQNMYEEGTKVTLTASSNKILTFTSWSSGETTAELQLDMNENRSLKANYSAIDFIAGWDFYLAGKEGRKADFAAEDNDADALVLRDADGKSIGWLDKCQANGGYEGKPAAVNWNTEGLGKYYWQTKVNAAAFTDIKVSSSMVYNYNAYTKYNVDYSLDGETWTTLGTIAMEGVKNWKTEEFALPTDANNKQEVYIRWKADTSSEKDGTTSNNDGIGISEIFITATAKLIDDGKAPQLVSSVPAQGATNVTANGSVVLTFDEKVKLAAADVKGTLASQSIAPTVSGKTVMFEYKGLDYDTEYTFSLPANSISDLTDNKLAEPVSITFRTKTRPVVTKALYDFIVPDDGTFTEALAAAAKRTDKTVRYRIFIKKGDYTIPADEKTQVTGTDGKMYPSATTYLSTPNVSIIGEDMTETSIKNTVPTELVSSSYGPQNPLEGIGRGDVLNLSKSATNTYFQDITLKSAMADATGRNIVLNDQSNKTICKDVCLWAYQDTYVSNNENSRFYFEGGLLRGRTDYLCGKGDVFYNAVELQMCGSGYLAVPSKPTKYGYIFKDCTITGESSLDGNYTLGRPWGSGTPIALFIDTKMEIIPSAIGWNEMSGGWPARFAEYNSMTKTGTVIDLSSRKTEFGNEGAKHTNNPVLTAEEAAFYTIANVMGAGDDWDPTAATEQASAPKNVNINGSKITWDDNQYVLLWAVCKDGNVVDFTTTNSYDKADATSKWSVRAANEMGGLGDATEAKEGTGINEAQTSADVVSEAYYSLDGTRVSPAYHGIAIKVVTMSDGTVKSTKIKK